MSRAQSGGVRIPAAALRAIIAVGAAIVVIAVLVGLNVLAQANAPRSVATAAEMKVQQSAAERDIERAYEQASGQVLKVRALNLAISSSQADQIASKALSDLKALRRSAFVSIAQILGQSGGDADAYASAVEQRFDQAPLASASASPAAVLLAPRFYTIVSRMSELSTQIANNATTALTASPSQSPTPRPTSSPSPTR